MDIPHTGQTVITPTHLLGKNGGHKWGSQMGVTYGGHKWGSQMGGSQMGGHKWGVTNGGSQMGVKDQIFRINVAKLQ